MVSTPTLERADVELSWWEEELFHEDAKCEFTHVKTVCSVEVTHILTGCQPAIRGCDTAAKATLEYKERPTSVCDACGRPAADCWAVRPI